MAAQGWAPKWGDAVGHPSGQALRAAGYTGMFGYVGTPGLEKSLTAEVYRDWTAAGLGVIGIYERFVDDIDGGYQDGREHAAAAVADMIRIGMPSTTVIGPAVDEHLTAAQIPLAVEYQRGFYDGIRASGWVGPVMGYGFSEFTRAAAGAGVAEVLWQCGARDAVWPGVHFWQDNTGIEVVAGVTVDMDWQLAPVTARQGGEDDMAVQTFPFPATGALGADGKVTDSRRHVLGTETASMSKVAAESWCWVKSGWGPIESVRIIAIGDASSPDEPARYLADQTWTNLRCDADRALMAAPDGTDQYSVEIHSAYPYAITIVTDPK